MLFTCRKIYLKPVLAFLLLLGKPALAFNGLGNADGLVASAADVQAGVEIVKTKLEERGFSIVLVVNHEAAAASVGLELRPTQVVLARPSKRLERSLLYRSATIGLDLPIKVLVFEDADGAVRARFNSVGYLFDRHDLYVFDRSLSTFRHKLSSLGDIEGGVVSVKSNQSFEDTVNTLLSELESRGFRIPLTLDFNESNWHYHNNWRLPTLIVFGNPNVGTSLMQEQQTHAIDLPQKFLIHMGRHGDVFISYNDPVFLATRHGVVNQDAKIDNIANALAAIAAVGASR